MKNIKLIFYMLGYIWKADKGGFVWMTIYLFWIVIPTTFNALIYKFLIDAITLKKPLSQVILIVVLYAMVDFIMRALDFYLDGSRYKRLG